jgi:SAM-dependent methyltransferase
MSAPVLKPEDIKILPVTQEQFNGMASILAKHPYEMLLSPLCRQYLAQNRFKGAGVNVFGDPDSGTMPGTVSHNRQEVDSGAFNSSKRTLRLINPLMAIEGVYEAPHELDVLSIGPRTEMELLHLVGAGFMPRRVKALDLISTSPWIEAGDMHAMPYPDRSFDVVISSWVLIYSRDPQKAVDEMVRVIRDGGLIAIGGTYNPAAAELEYKDAGAKIQGTMFRRVDQYKALLGDRLDTVHFQDEPRADVKGPVMLIGRIRHA